ncbi:MAG: AAA family ATPase [Planctomycetaceae bacterium]|nr:AAA family ATPase [Planctomycetaceae bacterium]
MYLSHLQLNSFRSFANEQVSFQSGLTVLVGENNGGKSNIIDAIRLVSTPLSGRRDLYCEQTDIRFGATPSIFELRATFSELSPPQQGRLLSATTDDTLQEACFGLTYDASSHQAHIRPTLWAGRFKAAPEPGCHEMIRHVYLPPLRDARRVLASGNPSRVHALLNHFLGENDPDEVARSLARASNHEILTNVDTAVATGLDKLTSGVRRQQATLGFNTDEKLLHIARDLRFKLADHGIAPEDLQYSGHGFANLLYIATIAVELERTDNAELTLFLVEEPEAHLHPQLQAAVLNFLEEQAQESLKENADKNAPAGQLQVIVATHSPNLSAWVPSKRLVFVRSAAPPPATHAPVQVPKPSHADDSKHQESSTTAMLRRESRCISLAKLKLTEPERRKVDRYLDVTKSAMLFGGRVLLVEGIAEAILLPVIAKMFVLNDKPDAFRVFRSAVFVPIDGVDFAPFAKVLLSTCNGVRIADRLVIVTDGDKHTVDPGKESPGESRKSELQSIATATGSDDVLQVCLNTYSLETELVNAGNASAMKEAYLTLHPRSETNWDKALADSDDGLAKGVQGLFKNTPKGDFAHLLAENIQTAGTFHVPGYIRDAIEALVR